MKIKAKVIFVLCIIVMSIKAMDRSSDTQDDIRSGRTIMYFHRIQDNGRMAGYGIIRPNIRLDGSKQTYWGKRHEPGDLRVDYGIVIKQSKDHTRHGLVRDEPVEFKTNKITEKAHAVTGPNGKPVRGEFVGMDKNLGPSRLTAEDWARGVVLHRIYRLAETYYHQAQQAVQRQARLKIFTWLRENAAAISTDAFKLNRSDQWNYDNSGTRNYIRHRYLHKIMECINNHEDISWRWEPPMATRKSQSEGQGLSSARTGRREHGGESQHRKKAQRESRQEELDRRRHATEREHSGGKTEPAFVSKRRRKENCSYARRIGEPTQPSYDWESDFSLGEQEEADFETNHSPDPTFTMVRSKCERRSEKRNHSVSREEDLEEGEILDDTLEKCESDDGQVLESTKEGSIQFSSQATKRRSTRASKSKPPIPTSKPNPSTERMGCDARPKMSDDPVRQTVNELLRIKDEEDGSPTGQTAELWFEAEECDTLEDLRHESCYWDDVRILDTQQGTPTQVGGQLFERKAPEPNNPEQAPHQALSKNEEECSSEEFSLHNLTDDSDGDDKCRSVEGADGDEYDCLEPIGARQ